MFNTQLNYLPSYYCFFCTEILLYSLELSIPVKAEYLTAQYSQQSLSYLPMSLPGGAVRGNIPLDGDNSNWINLKLNSHSNEKNLAWSLHTSLYFYFI